MNISKKLENLAKRTYRNATPNIMGQKWAWVFAFSEKGRKVVDGPFAVSYGAETCDEAENILAEFPSGEIFVLRTRSMPKAKSEIKAILLSRGENPDVALMRILKKKST